MTDSSEDDTTLRLREPPSDSPASHVPWARDYRAHLSEIMREQAVFESEVTMAKSDEEKLALKRQQVAKLNADIRALENKAKRDERKKDARRKILVGAQRLQQVERGQYPLEQLQREMRAFLTRPADFALFGLEAPAQPADD